MIDPLQIRPLHDRILVRKLEEKPSGLILSLKDPHIVDGIGGDYRRRQVIGVVAACGPGITDEKGRFHPMWVKAGDVIAFGDWDDLSDALPGYCMIRQNDVWGHAQA